MTLAIKRINNLPPHLSYVSILPDITENHNTALTSWSRGSSTLGPYSSGHHQQSQWQTRLHACVKVKGRNFKHLLWFSHKTSLYSHFRYIKTGSFQSHSQTFLPGSFGLPYYLTWRSTACVITWVWFFVALSWYSLETKDRRITRFLPSGSTETSFFYANTHPMSKLGNPMRGL